MHELVKLHGGTIEVESRSARAPRSPCNPDRQRAPAAGQIGGARAGWRRRRRGAFVEEALRWLPDAGPAGARRAETTTEPRDRRRRPRILVADDNADMRSYLPAARAALQVEAVADGILAPQP